MEYIHTDDTAHLIAQLYLLLARIAAPDLFNLTADQWHAHIALAERLAVSSGKPARPAPTPLNPTAGAPAANAY